MPDGVSAAEQDAHEVSLAALEQHAAARARTHAGGAVVDAGLIDLDGALLEESRGFGVGRREPGDDQETGEEFTIRAKQVVNATGVWAQQHLRGAGDALPDLRRCLDLARRVCAEIKRHIDIAGVHDGDSGAETLLKHGRPLRGGFAEFAQIRRNEDVLDRVAHGAILSRTAGDLTATGGPFIACHRQVVAMVDQIPVQRNVVEGTTDAARRNETILAGQKRALEQAYTIPTIWWHRIIITHRNLKGWHITPSHYVGQDLADVWLE